MISVHLQAEGDLKQIIQQSGMKASIFHSLVIIRRFKTQSFCSLVDLNVAKDTLESLMICCT